MGSYAKRLYDAIGDGYSGARRTEPRIARSIWKALGSATRILNVGAGTGSYEPPDRCVIALEPSATMRAQRPAGAAPCVAGIAESLPFADQSFDAAMAILSDQHWQHPVRGLREMQRVARRVVVFQWDDRFMPDYWLVRDYLPEVLDLLARPTLEERARTLGARMEPVLIPWDCVDGFFHAYWRRPEAYLNEAVRRGSSPWARVGRQAEDRAVRRLREDLESGQWQVRNRHLLEMDEADLGARLLVSDSTADVTLDALVREWPQLRPPRSLY